MKYNSQAWNNKYYSWNLLENIRKKSGLISSKKTNFFENILGSNFKKREDVSEVSCFVGYNPVTTLHLGSLIPLLNILEFSKRNKIKKLIVSINDVEAISSRDSNFPQVDMNIDKIKTICLNLLKKFNLKYNQKIPVDFVVRSKKREIWFWISEICKIKDIDKFMKKIYGDLPMHHRISTLVMVGEFMRVLNEEVILTSYGYEELVHLKFIEQIAQMLGKNKLFYLIFLPIASFIKNKKMSKSLPSSSLYIINEQSNLETISKRINLLNCEGINQFLEIWNKVFGEIKNSSPSEQIISIIKELDKTN